MAIQYRVTRPPSQTLGKLTELQSWLNTQGTSDWNLVEATENGVFVFDDQAAGGSSGESAYTTVNANSATWSNPTQSNVTQEINAQTGTSYTLQDSDHGKLVTLDNAAAIALSVDTGLRSDFGCVIAQKGAGQVTVGGTATVNEADGYTKLEKQWASASIKHLGSDVYWMQGRTA